MRALYRPHAGEDWRDVELMARHAGGFVVREVGPFWPGVMLATVSQVRQVVGEIEEPPAPANARLAVPVRRMPIGQRRLYRKLRDAGIGREQAFAAVTA